MQTNDTPYAELTPDLILDAVESLGFRCSGSLFAMNSYENRVYQIGIEEASPIIAKFYRPQRWSNDAIVEEHEFALELSGFEIPVIAPLVIKDNTLHEHQGFRFALFPRRGGRALELDNMAQLEQMGRFLARIHRAGATRKFAHRIRLDNHSYGEQPYQFLLTNNFIPSDIQHNFNATTEAVLQAIRQQFEYANDIAWLRIHGDCHAGNILCLEQAFHIVDLDDCLMGPAVQDIWMMLSGPEHETKVQLRHILDGYHEFHDFNPCELQLVESLRTLRMIHYAGWLAKRWQDPAFPASFPWFNTPRYWENLLYGLREQLDKF